MPIWRSSVLRALSAREARAIGALTRAQRAFAMATGSRRRPPGPRRRLLAAPVIRHLGSSSTGRPRQRRRFPRSQGAAAQGRCCVQRDLGLACVDRIGLYVTHIVRSIIKQEALPWADGFSESGRVVRSVRKRCIMDRRQVGLRRAARSAREAGRGRALHYSVG
jgi:hypothetical protein